ncbi:hypothetical protein K9M74_04420 [Candidatus Woesearchaeota archaeon]|nr:hypothetical protein [Candidatus Woesearchaeota archaeon]
MRGETRAQVAMEYLIIFSIAFLMTMPLVIIFATQTSNLQSDIANAQLEKAASEIIDAASEVYFMGSPAQQTIRVTFPDGIILASITNKALVFTMQGATYNYTYVKDTTINLTGTLKTFEGTHKIVVKAQGAVVSLEDT